MGQVVCSTKAQELADMFNKTYWLAAAQDVKPNQTDGLKLYRDASLLARQLVMVLGQNGILHDKLLDPEYPNKFTLEKKRA